MTAPTSIIPQAICRTDGRRTAIRAARADGTEVNGVDEVEVGDDGLTLSVTFLGHAPDGLEPANVRIDGGRRITGVEAVAVEVEHSGDPELDDRLVVTLDKAGDRGPYRLALVEADPYGRPGDTPYPGFDQRYFTAEFRFWPQCPSPFDCAEHGTEGCGCEKPEDPPATGVLPPPRDYTARDYDTLRTLLLERLALTIPDWTERNPADLGVTLAELLAATGDRLSYAQDAVATEAYLDTARLRVSLRRHTRLIDYPMDDGANARTVVLVGVDEPVTLRPGTFRFAAGAGGRAPVLDDRDLDDPTAEVFEPLGHRPLRLRPEHAEIPFWTWGDERCHLPEGVTEATLRDGWADDACTVRSLDLHPGDLLVLEEVRGPKTGDPLDADPGHRHAVRLTFVTPGLDALAGQPVLEVAWAEEDALPFPLCLSSVGPSAAGPSTAGRSAAGGPDCAPIKDVSVARGNAVLADHGRSLTFGGASPERFTVPEAPPAAPCCDARGFGCGCPPRKTQAAPFELVLAHHPVTQAGPYPDPRHVAAGQAVRLTAIPDAVRARLTALWRSARDDDGLGDEEIAELTVLFGSAVDAAALRQHPVPALRDLLHREDRLLAAKRRRLEVLIARARAGTVLDARTTWEIARTWGRPYAEGLHPDDPVLHGPAGHRPGPRDALPALVASDGERLWTPRRDLLASGPYDPHLVGEVGDDGRLTLRFGDGRHGDAPEPGARFAIDYRVGGGTRGNVGAEAIGHLLYRRDPDDENDPLPPVTGVRNPLPATGGTAPEAMDRVRAVAPLEVRRRRLRAITAADYAALAGALPGVRRAAAQIRWTGSLYEAHVAIDTPTGEPPPALLEAVAQRLEPYRRIGHDVVVLPPRYVPLDVALEACAEPGHRHGWIRAELYRRVGATLRGRTFGTDIRASVLVAVAAAVPGVRSVRLTRLRRLHEEDAGELDAGLLEIGRLEVARCDNDPARPENGLLTIDVLDGGER